MIIRFVNGFVTQQDIYVINADGSGSRKDVPREELKRRAAANMK